MKVLIAGVIWNAAGPIGANEALAARLAERELARIAEVRAAGERAESEAA